MAEKKPADNPPSGSFFVVNMLTFCRMLACCFEINFKCKKQKNLTKYYKYDTIELSSLR